MLTRPRVPLPRSLRGQFMLALSVLSLLILAGGVAAVYALRMVSGATQQLAGEQLMRMQDAQDLVQRTLLIERETERLMASQSLPMVKLSYAAIVQQMTALERVVAGLASADDDVAVLDLHQSSQLYRNNANVVARLGERALQTELAFAQMLEGRSIMRRAAASPQAQAMVLLLYRLQNADEAAEVERLQAEFVRMAGSARALPSGLRGDLAAVRARGAGQASTDAVDPFVLRLRLIDARAALRQSHDQLGRQAEAMVAAARLQSSHFDNNYRSALLQLADASRHHQRLVLVLLVISLLFAWLVGHVFLVRHVLRRLQRVSHSLQSDGPIGAPLDIAVQGRDEIGDMARSVNRFLDDRARLVLQTSELCLTKEYLVRQGRVLEKIAAGAPLPDVLDQLTHLIESQLVGIRGSVLLLDEDGLHLRHGSGPNLPPAYVQAIDGVRIGPCVGSCGTAVHRREPVVVADVQADPLWADFRALAAVHDLRSCWSAPILSGQGVVLGTFAMYSSSVRVPTAAETQLIELATRIAGIAIERQRADERIRHMAHHDDLTGLPNRALLDDRLAQALAQAYRSGRPMALLVLDLDGFKSINDSYGHAFGDSLLTAVARRLAGVVRQGDTVARLGGDEFVLMLVDLVCADDAVMVAQKIVDTMALPLTVGTRSLHVSASIGICTYTGDSSTGETLLKHADVAMYRAKQQGRNRYQCYSHDMGLQALQHMELQAALRQALEARQFELHYQPQVDLRTGRINAMEALIRWHHPVLGTISPARFIPVAEETGLIVPIGEWVLRTACAQLKAWHLAGHGALCVAVNLSVRQFQGHDVAQMVRRVLEECELDGRFLELELTESALMLDTESVLQALRTLKSTGVLLALDDFGTGYSSLSLLRRFPIDVIKIDQSFTFDVGTSTEAASITRAIIAMAQSLDMKTVAEGVETEQQLAFMAAQHCDSMQGYLFSRPLPVSAMSALLLEDRRIALPGRAEPVSRGAATLAIVD